jgi:hypothetical protein
MTVKIFGQILGIIATLVITSAYQANTKKRMLMIQTPGVVVLCVSYLMLGAISGFALNIACVARNVCCMFIKEKTKGYYVMTGTLMCLIGALGVLSWEGYLSLLLILALIVNTFFVALGIPQILRYSLVVTSSMCLIYNIAIPTPSIGGILLESITIASAIVGIVRFWWKKKGEGAAKAV